MIVSGSVYQSISAAASRQKPSGSVMLRWYACWYSPLMGARLPRDVIRRTRPDGVGVSPASTRRRDGLSP